MAKKERPGKGLYGTARLPVTVAYPPRPRRRRLWAAAGTAALAALAGAGAAFLVGDGRPVAPGPVASAHANVEAACSACHQGFRPVAAESCLACHGRVAGGGGRYAFAAHFADRGRAASGEPVEAHEELARWEVSCAACHREHQGRSAPLTAVADALCTGCHPFGSFGRDHPEIEVLRAEIPDEPNLAFPHRLHVAEVTNRLGLDEPRRACLECHQPDEAGEGFRPLDFDRHCDACHLTAADRTPRLPAGDPADAARPGVLTLADFQREWGPAARWAAFTSPDEVRAAGDTVVKSPVYHEDPWILANLRRIRRTLYGDLGLAGLLDTAVDEGSFLAGGDELYREAIAELEERLAVLRSVPGAEVQEEVRRLEELLGVAEERLRAGEGTGSTTPFLPGERAAGLSAEHAGRLERLALDLTAPCRRCHVVSDAAIQRVQKDQRVLVRADFDHGAHLLEQPDCLACHGAIPRILEGAPRGEDDPTDVAATHNLPSIVVCQECHGAGRVADSCVTCHRFHPAGSRHAGLVRFAAAEER